MDYLYENLGDERFQEFCASLISKEFPNIQSFPVGQPDGGRDLVLVNMSEKSEEFIVFQVKFVRNPNQNRDIVGWLTEIISNEAKKINRLVKRGAKAYYLLTNLRGTAHLDKGSKDRINEVLKSQIDIPSLCWWRDDLTVLFEKDPLFKWSFPEILNGQDILNSALFRNLRENDERRKNVIRSYLIDQYEIDNEVKFKQIDLQNRLFNLFTDVPLKLKKYNERNTSLKYTYHSLNNIRHIARNASPPAENNNNFGAAAFLLHSKVQNELQRILLEGGPGQGKSTISQYVCQVHRVKLLNNKFDIDLLPNHIKNVPIRLPFKVDLRDVASWVEKKNPYQNILGQEYFERVWQSSLEAFLTAHVYYHSKIEGFVTNDFIEICKSSAVLLVFDGFDEIANIKVRGEVIEFINKGITRISGNAISIQVVITSRPAAFSDSVGFSADNYPHFELTDITPTIINEYVEKWIRASKIDDRDAAELRRLVKEKLEMPHLKDLAKSPMQLAIFISLLRTKGQSLPNKRTALYDSYIELFFDRESEKNILIRDERYLIIAIHEYLAWILHSEAELYKTNGSIEIDELKRKLKDYLNREGHEASIADKLFDVVKERVCALISRVQGTFEFEVQPLREYFCAKYLYKSAPHSSAGSIKPGTKPDRLHAILRNFYWQNVVRFFAGCADAGELDMIIQELRDLQNDELLTHTIYPLTITAQILSDYVFNQKPLKLKDVLKIITDTIAAGKMVNQSGFSLSKEPILLPKECGRDDIVKECFFQLTNFPSNDYAAELIAIVNNNASNSVTQWMQFLPQFKGEHLNRWLQYGQKLNIITAIEDNVLENALKGDNYINPKNLQILIESERSDVINKNMILKEKSLEYILNDEVTLHPNPLPNYSLSSLCAILSPFMLSYTLNVDNPGMNFGMYMAYHAHEYQRQYEYLDDLTNFESRDNIDKRIQKFVQSIKTIFEISITQFKTNLEPWEALVETGRKIFKDQWVLSIIATSAAGIKSRTSTFEEYTNLHDTMLPLCRRTRCARLKSGNSNYWDTQFKMSENHKFTLLVFLTWATPKTIIELLPQVSQLITNLTPKNLSLLVKALKITSYNSTFTSSQQKIIEQALTATQKHDYIKFLLSFRFRDGQGAKFVFDSVNEPPEIIEDVLGFKLEYLVNSFLESPSSNGYLEDIKRLYKKISECGDWNYYLLPLEENKQKEIPYEIARDIIKDNHLFPRAIVTTAERACRLFANKCIKPVGDIAITDKWFD